MQCKHTARYILIWSQTQPILPHSFRKTNNYWSSLKFWRQRGHFSKIFQQIPILLDFIAVIWRCVLFSSYEGEALQDPDCSHCYKQGFWLKRQLTTAWDWHRMIYNNPAVSTWWLHFPPHYGYHRTNNFSDQGPKA